MNTKFDHFILTPFNLATKWRKAVYADNDWMERRLDIFKRVTVPSIESQTNQNFTWIVVCDSQTPSKWKDAFWKIDARFHLTFAKPDPTIWERLIGSLQTSETIITTRLDNDDAIHEDFINCVQSKFNPLNKGYLNFLHGFVTDGHRLFKVGRKSNPFTSMKTNIPNKHIRMMKHVDIQRQEGFHQVRELPPLWLVYVHGDNVGNRLPDDPTCEVEIDQIKGFHVDLPMTQRLRRKN